MATINETTRRMITTAIKVTTDEYRSGWDRIFGGLPTAKTPAEAWRLHAAGCRCDMCSAWIDELVTAAKAQFNAERHDNGGS